MKMKAVLISVSFLFFASVAGFSQQPAPAADTKPLELPNFIIEGREQLNVQSGIKQFTDKTSYLNKKQLDSLNSLEKQQSLLLPQKQLPNSLMSFDYRKGFVTAQFGRYVTPSLEAGYNMNMQGFNLFANGGFEYSGGNVTNSDYTKAFIKVNSEYVADDKFLVFGGSKTTTDLFFRTNSYKLYHKDYLNPPKRTMNNFGIGLSSDGSYDGYDFMTGAAFRTLGLSLEDGFGGENAVKAFLKINKNEKDYAVGANLLMDFHAFRGSAVNTIDAYVNGKYLADNVLLKAEAGFQMANSSQGTSRGNFLISANLDYYLSKVMTMKAEFSSKLGNKFFMDYVQINPYIADSVTVDFGNTTGIKAQIKYEPTENFDFSLGMDYGVSARSPYFSKADTGLFMINYEKTTNFGLYFDGFWAASKTDAIGLNFRFSLDNLPDGKVVPFTSPVNFSVKYSRLWFENFGSEIAFVYIGERFSDRLNKTILKNYYDMKLHISYKLSKGISIFADLNNLLNNDVYIWSGYKERDMFFNVGLTWQF